MITVERKQELREAIARVLAPVYMRVDWRGFSSHKRPRDDVFIDRVKAARNKADIAQAVQHVCNHLDVNMSSIRLEDLRAIADDAEAMEIWRDYPEYVAMIASDKASQRWAENKTDSTKDEKQKTLATAED